MAARRAVKTATRRRLGTLSDRKVAAGTLKRYKNEVGKFLQWVVMSKLELPTNILELDDLLCIFVEELWASGESVSLAEGCISGIHHFIPQLALRTPGPQKLIKAWHRTELPRRAPPLSPEIVKGMAGLAIIQGKLDVGVGLLVSFHAFLRGCELLNLRFGDIHFCHNVAILNLGLTKGGLRRGAAEQVTVTDVSLVTLLRQLSLGRKRSDPLISVQPRSFRDYFQRILVFFGLGPGFTLHSLRRGGATYFFMKTGNMACTIERGRWECVRTARIYISEGLAQLANHSLNVSKVKALFDATHAIQVQALECSERQLIQDS